MKTYRRVFAAIDFSASSGEALREAHARALADGAQLAVCHIVPNQLRCNLLFPHLSRAAALAVPVEVERVADAIALYVGETTGRSGKDFIVIADYGSPYVELLKAAEDWKADLIVIGSHGMTSAAGVLLGGVSNKIIRYAQAPVLVVRGSAGGGGIVAGTDFSDPALPAIAAAVAESKRTGRKLTVMHSLELTVEAASHIAVGAGAPTAFMTEADYAEMKQAANTRLQEALDKFDAEGERVVEVGPAGPALVDQARKRSADLLVVGATGSAGFGRILLGGVAEMTAAHAPCSVLVTRLHPE